MRAVLLLMALATATAARAETAPPEQPAESPWSLDLTVHDVGIGIGNSKHVDGLRLNFRDVAPFVVHGVNLTVWSPAPPAGIVNGLALGVPVTGAAVIRGLALGVGLGAATSTASSSAGWARGVAEGCAALPSVASASAPETVSTVSPSACSASAPAATCAGCSSPVSARERRAPSAAIAALGVGAPRVRGGMAALVAGGEDVVGVVLAPAYFEVRPGGTMSGVSISAFNRIRGAQHGLAIGIVNYTPELHGVQIGLINWAGNNAAGLKVLPIVNAHVD